MKGEMFLPITMKDVKERGWAEVDFVYVCGDAYVDHPSFGAAIITRVLEAEGFNVAVLSQPKFKTFEDFKRFGKPRLGFLVSAGNIDSMVAHYTVAKRKRNYDYYSPGGKMGLRPDRATEVYSKLIREAYPDSPIILGGLEASLRRFSHYDYWDDKILESLLVSSGADILTYGMGENIIRKIAKLLDKGVPVSKIRDVRGTVWLGNEGDKIHFPVGGEFDFDRIKNDKKYYAESFALQYKNQDSVYGKALVEHYGNKILVQNPPMPPLEREELDEVYALPYMRNYHPVYEKDGGVPAITEVQFSITHNRGCFGGCNFCALAFHQGRSVRSRSIESVVEEAKLITTLPGFKGYINDIGGPTANFRYPACDKQKEYGVCPDKKCLAPEPCKNLKADHSEYIELLKQVEQVPKIKKVFIRSGIRYDYINADKTKSGNEFFKKLVKDHVSGQLKVAPEHCSGNVLHLMGKPDFKVYEKFKDRYFELTKSFGKEQYLVPYLMSSHPGSTLNDAIKLSEFIKRWNYNPEQVQDFYPTPGTASTVMFYTGLDPFTMKEVYVPKSPEEKRMQRALLQCGDPKNADLVRTALRKCHREDLIGYDKKCLVKPSYKDRVDSAKRQKDTRSKKTARYSKNNIKGKRR
ncbi:MAG: YgiQ family radical SAM protein [Acutalibacteraceae bacterium]